MCQGSIRVLHIDDEPGFTDLTAAFLESVDGRFTVETATSDDETVEVVGDHPPECDVPDYNVPSIDGVALLQTVREEVPELRSNA